MSKSPYLKLDNRLSDVIAAIQAMATYKYYKLEFSAWADRISGDPSRGDYWKQVFIEHPEFFRLDSKKERASLVIRRQHQKRYDIDNQRLISTRDFYALDDQSRISRSPLTPAEITSLVSVAIELHSRAIARAEHSRWWLPMISAVLGFIGAMIGAVAGG